VRAKVLHMLAQCAEFENVAVRDDEMIELETLARKCCPYEIKGGIENKTGKISILLQVTNRLVLPRSRRAPRCS
jgi:activating signal cointegrator complex subunit 3